MLDLVVIIFISFGLLEFLKDNKVLGVVSLVLIFGFLGYVVVGESLTAQPLISQEELQEIEQLQNVEEDASVLATTSYYSPWVLGYSGRTTFAPGLFEDTHTLEEWQVFWNAQDYEEIEGFLAVYEKPLYIHVGQIGRFNTTKFDDDCFEVFIEEKVWKWTCSFFR